jgi:short-subunit dehydrogenase involved in D-alanine esterification of teichoic acids
MENLELDKLDQEIDINIRGPIHLATAFLPHFKSQEKGAVIMNVTSVLGFCPSSIINPNVSDSQFHRFVLH